MAIHSSRSTRAPWRPPCISFPPTTPASSPLATALALPARRAEPPARSLTAVPLGQALAYLATTVLYIRYPGICADLQHRPHLLRPGEPGQNMGRQRGRPPASTRPHTALTARAPTAPHTVVSSDFSVCVRAYPPSLASVPVPTHLHAGHAMRWYGGVSVLPARMWRACTVHKS